MNVLRPKLINEPMPCKFLISNFCLITNRVCYQFCVESNRLERIIIVYLQCIFLPMSGATEQRENVAFLFMLAAE